MPKTMTRTVYLCHHAAQDETDDPRGSIMIGQHNWEDDNQYGYTNIAMQEVIFTIREDWDPIKAALQSLEARETALRANFENALTGLRAMKNNLLAIGNSPTDELSGDLSDVNIPF